MITRLVLKFFYNTTHFQFYLNFNCKNEGRKKKEKGKKETSYLFQSILLGFQFACPFKASWRRAGVVK